MKIIEKVAIIPSPEEMKEAMTEKTIVQEPVITENIGEPVMEETPLAAEAPIETISEPADFSAASEWLPDPSSIAAQSAEADAPNEVIAEPAPVPELVTMISDPFQLPMLDVAEAQLIDGEIDLNDDELLTLPPIGENEFRADEGDIEKLAAAIAEQEQQDAVETAELAQSLEQEAAARLAAEIAEDQQLAQAIQAEESAVDADVEAALPAPNEEGQLDVAEVSSCLEAILFMSDKPLSINKLRDLIGPDFPMSVFQEAITSLMDRYQAPNHGIELLGVAGGYQFRTKPSRAPLARKLARVQPQRLSGGALETLAITAYRQPVMKEDIDKVRGVDSSYFIRGLLEKKLIKISGRSELPGRPMLYSTTSEFLELFGLKDLAALPSLRELEQMIPASQTANPDEEDPRLIEMRRLVGEMKVDQSTSLLYDPREDEKILREIREQVSAIPTSTPFIDEQKAAEKAAELGPLPVDMPIPVSVMNQPAPAPID